MRRGIRPLLSFVTQTVSHAAEVKWDTAVVESKVMLTALVSLFLCDFVCDLSGWVVCVAWEKQQGTLCCHLSVRGDPGRRCQLVHWRQVPRLWTLRAACSCITTVKHKPALYFRKVNIHSPGKADTSYSRFLAAASFSLKLDLERKTKSCLALSALQSDLHCRFEKLKVMFGLFVVGFYEILIHSQYIMSSRFVLVA